ncbi:tumor protein D54-like isoform X2 [Myripristis murdjan]|uniref:tumor protein D54-like isoform X2 n=1 Tax=Myripristis murdjan TaxID=586833 RepID=UPI001175F0D2|nr:tumor protein D54-like isoform X2 [Myripristis murdjan]
MNRQGFGGTSSMNFSTGATRNGGPHSDLTEEDLEDLRIELTKVEDEIQTLRQVLLAKEKYAMDIKRQLGLSPLSNIKQNLAKGWQEVQTSAPYLTASATLEDISNSNAYKRTQDTLSHAGQVTSAALSSMGVAITRRLADMRALPLPSPPRHTISVPAMSGHFSHFPVDTPLRSSLLRKWLTM